MVGLKWMKEKGFIDEDEYDNSMKHIMEKKKPTTSGDPHPGSSTGAAAAVAMPPAPPPKRKVENQNEAWVRANALPKVKGCTIFHDTCNKTRWYGNYPGKQSRSRNYGDGSSTNTRTPLECLNHVLNWIWGHHTEQTGVECPWDFTPRCD